MAIFGTLLSLVFLTQATLFPAKRNIYSDVIPVGMLLNPLYDEFSTLQTKLIPRSQIELKQEIAKGQFGKVFKGKVILD